MIDLLFILNFFQCRNYHEIKNLKNQNFGKLNGFFESFKSFILFLMCMTTFYWKSIGDLNVLFINFNLNSASVFYSLTVFKMISIIFTYNFQLSTINMNELITSKSFWHRKIYGQLNYRLEKKKWNILFQFSANNRFINSNKYNTHCQRIINFK